MEIKKCPCCGSEAIYGANEGKHTIKCLYCGLQITDDRMDKVIGLWNQREGKADSTSEKDLRVCEVIASACECLPEWRKTKIEENAFPYGDNLSFDECGKCGYKWNIHVV